MEELEGSSAQDERQLPRQVGGLMDALGVPPPAPSPDVGQRPVPPELVAAVRAAGTSALRALDTGPVLFRRT